MTHSHASAHPLSCAATPSACDGRGLSIRGDGKLRVLDLFSGIGGFSLGLERTGGFETVAFCEIESFPRKVLAKHWPEVFCHDDVRTLTKETLCKGYAQNALLNRLCAETGGDLATVKSATTRIKKHAERKMPPGTMSGPQNVAEALSTIMAGSVPVAEKANTLFWQLTTPLITEALSGQHTRALFGNSLSSGDFQTIIRFSATIAIWQSPSTVPAHIKSLAGVTDDDVTELTGEILARDGITVDVITGGFPCQDISAAGKQAGMGDGTRSGLWSEIVRLTGELRPRYVIVENVAALLSGPAERRGGWFGRVLGDLAECGYDAEWENIPASAVGAPHRRERVWVVAYCQEERAEQGFQSILQAAGAGQLGRGSGRPWIFGVHNPPVCHVDDGVPDYLDGHYAAGNAVIPQIPELIGRAILAAEHSRSPVPPRLHTDSWGGVAVNTGADAGAV